MSVQNSMIPSFYHASYSVRKLRIENDHIYYIVFCLTISSNPDGKTIQAQASG
jgi:hypothetical protein